MLHYAGMSYGFLGISGAMRCLCSKPLSAPVKWIQDPLQTTKRLCSQHFASPCIWMPCLQTYSQRPSVKT
jgi:hypothetical protein